MKDIKKYLPNLIYIGPDKSGSSWLYFIFKQHKDIYVPTIKDIYFFDKNFNKGIEWYVSFFKHNYKGEKFICDISHDYLFSEIAAKNIKNIYNYYKKSVILFSNLRDPVDKLWSHYLFLVRSGITKESVENAIKLYPELIEESMYYRNVKCYKDLFGNDYKIFLFEELKKDPKKFALNMFQEIGIEIDNSIEYEKKILPAAEPRNFYIAKIAKKIAVYLRENNFLYILGYLKSNSFINKILFKPYKEKPTISFEFARYLWKEYFKDDVIKLSELLGKDLYNYWGEKYE